jgi:predicted transposase/invertase (TIGR01784 family)
MNKAIAENPIISTAKEIESVFRADDKEKEQYFAYQRMLMDAYSAEHTHEYLLEQERKKTEKMVAIAGQNGIKEGLIKVARNLLKKGLDIDMIIEVSGLSREDIEKLH